MVLSPSIRSAAGERVVIIHSKKMIFIHIQRTGGNSISAALGEPTNSPDKHFSALELSRQCEMQVWNTYFKFAFVRNPWDRLVSWWSTINAARPAYERGAEFNNFHKYIFSRSATFQQFINDCDQEVNDSDGKKWIFRNQIDYLTDDSGNLLVDFIGRFEHLERDFQALTRTHFGEALTLPRSNYSFHDHYSSYYDPSLKDKVANRFARDIEAFGYVFENA